MKIIAALIFFVFALKSVDAQTHKLVFRTQFGDIKVMLYDFTPKHRDLILGAIKDSVYKDALFNRVIADFVVQGGEHDIDIARREALNPLQQKERLDPEFDDKAFHKIGTLGAGRDDNLQKASFLNQIYFVVGKAVSDNELNQLEVKKGKKFTSIQRSTYLKAGGQPRLDGDYTVFGEVYEGLDVLLEISKAKTDPKDFPVVPIGFKLLLVD